MALQKAINSLPLGVRFHPTDEELVGHYLKHMLLGNHSEVDQVIAEIDVCKFEPWDLPAFSKMESGDQEWFFFSPKGTRKRCDRKTKAGFWKPTGKDRQVKSRGTNDVIGTKKTLVFYEGRSSYPERTNWVIHEYHAVTCPQHTRDFVLCRLKKKAEETKNKVQKKEKIENRVQKKENKKNKVEKKDEMRNKVEKKEEMKNKAEKREEMKTDKLIDDEGEPSSHIAADFENQENDDRIPYVYTSPVNTESIFPTQPHAEEYDLASLQKSTTIHNQQYLDLALPQQPTTINNQQFFDSASLQQYNQQSFQDSSYPNSYIGEENITHFPWETIEDDDHLDNKYIEQFLNEILAGEDAINGNETIPDFVS
ncbi:hypothetical protein Fmac_010744 [Flemingia macrophylla]|uniref:NAC domain-containing protein n=1 Tax=Flemingia macrophylla TaxID=520843 RepID=A0ABD1MKF5_9FABA